MIARTNKGLREYYDRKALRLNELAALRLNDLAAAPCG